MSKNIYRIKKKGDLDEIMRNNFFKPICIVFASRSADEESYKNVSEMLLTISKKNSYIMLILIDFDDFIDNINYFSHLKENLPYFLCYFKGKNISDYDKKENFIPIIVSQIEKINESYLNKLMTLFNENNNENNNQEKIQQGDNNQNKEVNNEGKNENTEDEKVNEEEDKEEEEEDEEQEDEEEEEEEEDEEEDESERINKDKQKLKKIRELKKLQKMLNNN